MIIKSLIYTNIFTWQTSNCWRTLGAFLSLGSPFGNQNDLFLLRLSLTFLCLAIYDLRWIMFLKWIGIWKSLSSSAFVHPHQRRRGPRQNQNIISQNNKHNKSNVSKYAFHNAFHNIMKELFIMLIPISWLSQKWTDFTWSQTS